MVKLEIELIWSYVQVFVSAVYQYKNLHWKYIHTKTNVLLKQIPEFMKFLLNTWSALRLKKIMKGGSFNQNTK